MGKENNSKKKKSLPRGGPSLCLEKCSSALLKTIGNKFNIVPRQGELRTVFLSRLCHKAPLLRENPGQEISLDFIRDLLQSVGVEKRETTGPGRTRAVLLNRLITADRTKENNRRIIEGERKSKEQNDARESEEKRVQAEKEKEDANATPKEDEHDGTSVNAAPKGNAGGSGSDSSNINAKEIDNAIENAAPKGDAGGRAGGRVAWMSHLTTQPSLGCT